MAANPRRFILRPEHDEWSLIESHAKLFDAILVPEAYLAPYAPGDHFGGNPPDRLVKTAQEQGLPNWRDPQTPALCSRTILKLPASKRLLHTPLASVFPLPLDVQLFGNPAARRHALELTLSTQSACEAASGFYLGFGRRDSHAHRVNLQVAEEVAGSVASQDPTAFLSITKRRLLTGLAGTVAADYAAVGTTRVVLRVRGLKSERASREELIALLDAVASFSKHEVETVIDCAGMLGPVLIAGGADAFSTGTRFFRSVPSAILSASEGGVSVPIEAPASSGFSQTARPAGEKPREARIKKMESIRALTDVAVRSPDELVRMLAVDGSPHAAVWAAVLRDRKRKAA